MSLRLLAPAVAACLSLLLLSCGGGQATLPTSGSAMDPDALQLSGPALIGKAEQFAAGLPALAELNGAARATSISGPGWHALDPYTEGGFSALGNASGNNGAIRLQASSASAFAIYPVTGFSSDAFPTSLRLQVSDGQIGQYFVLAADFQLGRWRSIGPFNGDATVELPGLEEPLATRRYLSDSGLCYIGMLVAPVGDCEFSSIELGVDGGTEAPRPPAILVLPKGDESLYMSWVHSPDYTDADFAGYRLERAPQLFGDYETLAGGLVQGSSYVDNGIQSGFGYRYRLAAEDTSGNRSPWVLFQGSSDAAAVPDPVIVVHGPQGPLYGPVSVEFDFGTDSYDPQNIGITTYIIAGPDIGLVNAVDGKATLLLQPGCHMLQFMVQTSDLRLGMELRTLKVLPQWEDAPVLVADSPASAQTRILYPSALYGYQGISVVCGYDRTLQSMICWNQRYSDDEAFLDTLPTYWPVQWASRALYIGYGPTMAVAMDDRVWLAVFEENQRYWVEGPQVAKPAAIDILQNNNSNFLIATATGSVSDNLVGYRLDNLGNPVLLAENIGDIYRLVAAPRNSDGITYVFVQTLTEMLWYELDLQLQVIDSGQVAAGLIGGPLLAEIDPVTGRPLVIAAGSFYRWSMQDELGNWSAFTEIDNTELNRSGASTTTVDRIYCSFAHASGQARIYAFNGSGWDVHSVLTSSSNSGYPMALMNVQAGQHNIDMADTTLNGEMHMIRVSDDGGNTTLATLPRGEGQGSGMHAASGNGEIHLCWQNMRDGQSYARYTANDGQSWTDVGVLPSWDWVCSSDGLGSIYYSGQLGTDNVLSYWNGTSLAMQQSVAVNSVDYLAITAKRSLDDNTFWYTFDPGSMLAKYAVGHYSTGVPVMDYSTGSLNPPLQPVWDGVANTVGHYNRLLVHAGSGNPDQASIAVYEGTGTAYDMLVPSVYSSPLNLQRQDAVRSRSLATCSYLGAQLYLNDQAFFSTYGADAKGLRHIVEYSGLSTDANIPFSHDPLKQDDRRTVSCETTADQTGLMLMGDLDGRELVFEWSNYGQWEALAVPEALRGHCMHEIVVGNDGRWHILYRDRYSDRVWMLSTK